MNSTLRIAILVALVLYFVCIVYLLKKRSLNLKYTLLWLIIGVVMVVVVSFPAIIEVPFHEIGIVEMTNGLFGILFFGIFLLTMSLTSIVSKLNDKNRQLIQQCSLYEERIRTLEKEVFERAKGSSVDD